MCIRDRRQKEAVELAQVSDIVLVVGGRHSSNTEKLYQLCKSHCEKTYYIDNIAQLPLEKVTNHVIISIVAGASTPDWLIREVKTLMSDVEKVVDTTQDTDCLLYTSPSPRDRQKSRMPSSA